MNSHERRETDRQIDRRIYEAVQWVMIAWTKSNTVQDSLLTRIDRVSCSHSRCPSSQSWTSSSWGRILARSLLPSFAASRRKYSGIIARQSLHSLPTSAARGVPHPPVRTLASDCCDTLRLWTRCSRCPGSPHRKLFGHHTRHRRQNIMHIVGLRSLLWLSWTYWCR